MTDPQIRPLARRRSLAGLLLIAYGALSGGTVWAQAVAAGNLAPAAAADAPHAAEPAAQDLVKLLMHTALGDILLALDRGRAPITVGNFLHYVDLGRFDGISFYRAVKIDDEGKYGLVQGGLRGNPKRVFKPIAHESPRVTGLSHVDGAISMAREAPGTADADFFIVVGELVSLDGQPAGDDDPGYAVFGRVLQGMEVIRAMLDLPRDARAGEGAMQGQMLANPVQILTVRRAG